MSACTESYPFLWEGDGIKRRPHSPKASFTSVQIRASETFQRPFAWERGGVRGDQAWHRRESSENELVGQSTRPALPFFVASNRCGLKYWSQRKERKFKANARTISRASGRKPRRPASWKGMRLVPPFVAFLLGAEGGYWLHPTFPEILMGTTGVVLRRISKLFSNPSLGFIGQASPQSTAHPFSAFWPSE